MFERLGPGESRLALTRGACFCRYMVKLDGSGKELKVKPENTAFEDPADAPHAAHIPTNPVTAPSMPEAFTCAVCYEEYPFDRRAVLPCCGTLESTVQYCLRCIEVIVENGFAGTVGRCPTCSQMISIKDGSITSGQLVSNCRMCRQEKQIADTRNLLCEPCVLGRSYTMRYECARCQQVQAIPHPMWRYQTEGPASFGNVSWACHQQCGDYTMWRIVAQDANKIPPEHCPESWGRREEWLASIRQVRQQEMAGHAHDAGGNDTGRGSHCVIA